MHGCTISYNGEYTSMTAWWICHAAYYTRWVYAVGRWRRCPDGYAMLLISVVGYMLYEKPRWYTHWRLVDVYMLGLQPVPDKLATVQGRQAITRLQVKLQTTLLRCSFARYRERQNLAIFKFRWISVESSVFVSLWMPCRFSYVFVDFRWLSL